MQPRKIECSFVICLIVMRQNPNSYRRLWLINLWNYSISNMLRNCHILIKITPKLEWHKNFLRTFWRNLTWRRLKNCRNVLLFIDECPAHLSDFPLLTKSPVISSPLNCGNSLQPLYFRILITIKEQYRKAVV